MHRLVLFQVGDRQFGVDMPLVMSIRRAGALLAEQPGDNWGQRLEVDGEEMPLCDLPSMLGPKASMPGPSAKQKVMMVKSRNDSLALIVDRVDGVVSVETDRIAALPGVFEGPAMACFPRILRREDDLVLLLDPDGMRAMMADGIMPA